MVSKNNKSKILRKEPIPKGRSLKINLKMTDNFLEIFKEIKQRQACKTNSDVFNYIYKAASKLKPETIAMATEPPDQRWRTFVINEYILARLRKLAKNHEISPDLLVGITLAFIKFEMLVPPLKEAAKYQKEDYCLKVIGDIWEKVSELRDGLDFVFNFEYDGFDPENYQCWLGNIEGDLQELEDLVPKLFTQKAAKKT